MLLFFNENNEIASNTAMRCGIALSLHSQLHTILNTSWNINGNNLIAFNDSITMAIVTLIFDNTTFASTMRTGTLGLHHSKNSPLCFGDNTSTIALGTDLCLTVFSTTTTASLTGNKFTDLDFLLTATVNLLKGEFNLDTEITATQYTACAATTTKSAESCAETTSKKVSKYTAKLGKDVVHIHTTLAIGALHPCHAKLVVAGFLVGIAKHIVRLGSLLKLLFGLLIARIAIRMVLEGQLTVSLFQLFGSSILSHP